MSFLLYSISFLSFNFVISFPSTITSPDVALSIPPNIFNVVVFPAPDGPTITTSSPFSISKFVLFNAFIVTSPILYSLTIFLNFIFYHTFMNFSCIIKKIIIIIQKNR